MRETVAPYPADIEPSFEGIEKDGKFSDLSERIQETLGLTERELLSRMREKDTATYEHVLEVSTIMDSAWDSVSADLEKDEITHEDVIRAAALHDIGKLTLPDCILKNDLNNNELRNLFLEFAEKHPDEATELLRDKGKLSEEKTVSDLSKDAISSIDYRDAIPLSFLFRGNASAQAEIISADLDSSMTFMDALKKHETASEDIITGTNIPNRELVAALAGAHHNYRGLSEVRYEANGEKKTLPVLAAELLHQIDIFQSMTGNRQYQKSMLTSEATTRLRSMAKQKILDREVLERWLPAVEE